MRRLTRSLLLPAALLAGAIACGGDDGDNGQGNPGDGDVTCSGDKCDTPRESAVKECDVMCEGSEDPECKQTCRDGKATEFCEARRADAVEGSQVAYSKDFIRWACSDVAGVNTENQDDRGQEYCEYFAIVRPPPATEGGNMPPAVDLGRNKGNGVTTRLGLTLAEDQIFQLEDHADTVVGECVFTAWHADVPQGSGSLPVCKGSDATCPEMAIPEGTTMAPWITTAKFGSAFSMTKAFLQMKVGFNSNGAASSLVNDCAQAPLTGDMSNPEDPLHDAYFRGCWKTYQLFETEWRRSDPTICAAAARLGECGCGVDTDADGVADITDPAQVALAIVPQQPADDGSVAMRGFHLGTWSGMNELPAGCRYVETGDEGNKTVVTCDLTATDVLGSQNDVKQKCREKYGDNVVVHVPIPAAAVVCNPPDGPYKQTCDQYPWVIASTK